MVFKLTGSVTILLIVSLGLCVRSVCWEGQQVLIGTKCSEILEVSTDSRDNPKMLAQVIYLGLCIALGKNSYNAIYI